MARRRGNPFRVIGSGREWYVVEENVGGEEVSRRGPYRSEATALGKLPAMVKGRGRMAAQSRKKSKKPARGRRRKIKKTKGKAPRRMIKGKLRTGKTWVLRKSKIRPQKKFKTKPKRPPVLKKLRKELGSALATYKGRVISEPKQLYRFLDAPKVELRKKGKLAEVLDEEGRVIFRTKAYPGLKRDLKDLKEAYLGRISPTMVKRMKLKTVKGMKIEKVDAFYDEIVMSKRMYTGAVAIGEPTKAKPYWNERAGKMVDPKKYLGAFFERLSPQNWGDAVMRMLPAYARRSSAKVEVGVRVTYRTKSGVVDTALKTMSVVDAREIRNWIGLCASILSEIGQRYGYAGKNVVEAVDLLVVTPT